MSQNFTTARQEHYKNKAKIENENMVLSLKHHLESMNDVNLEEFGYRAMPHRNECELERSKDNAMVTSVLQQLSSNLNKGHFTTILVDLDVKVETDLSQKIAKRRRLVGNAKRAHCDSKYKTALMGLVFKSHNRSQIHISTCCTTYSGGISEMARRNIQSSLVNVYLMSYVPYAHGLHNDDTDTHFKRMSRSIGGVFMTILSKDESDEIIDETKIIKTQMWNDYVKWVKDVLAIRREDNIKQAQTIEQLHRNS